MGTSGPAEGVGGWSIFMEHCWEKRRLDLPLLYEMALPFGGDLGGNRSTICFSTCYAGFEQG